MKNDTIPFSQSLSEPTISKLKWGSEYTEEIRIRIEKDIKNISEYKEINIDSIL